MDDRVAQAALPGLGHLPEVLLLETVLDELVALVVKDDDINWEADIRCADPGRIKCQAAHLECKANRVVIVQRTVKHGRGVTRVELEERCTRALYRALWPLTDGRRVRKRRYEVPSGALTWEVDAFQDRELFVAEVELPAEDTEVVIPDWLMPYLVREVTGEDEFVNRNLAR